MGAVIPQRMLEKFWVNIIRYYTSEAHLLWKTRKIEFLKPTEVGFVCIVAISNRRGSINLDFLNNLSVSFHDEANRDKLIALFPSALLRS
jgi:hypothetical protein